MKVCSFDLATMGMAELITHTPKFLQGIRHCSPLDSAHSSLAASGTSSTSMGDL